MFTRFANPHALDSKTKTVSRGALTADDTEPTLEAVHDSVLLAELDRLVKRSLGDLDVSEGKEEKARKKRRKVANDLVETVNSSEPSACIPFRLVSRALPPRVIDLTIKTVSVIVEPPCEDNGEEAQRRKAQAQAVAVDIDWVLSESRKPSVRRTDHGGGLIHVKADIPYPPPPVIVVDQDKPTPKPPKIASAKPSLEVRPSPHTLRSDISVPVVAVAAAPEQTLMKKSTRNIRRARAKARSTPTRPPAVFWRPLKEWGLRAAGYSVGREGSWPVYQNDPARYQYQRDTMRKGVFSTGPR